MTFSCITACGRCRFCKEGHYGLCVGGGGWIFGHLIDGLVSAIRVLSSGISPA